MSRRLLAVAAIAGLLLPACLAERRATPEPTGSATALPIVGLDPCPATGELLAADAEGGDLLPDLELDCLSEGPAVRLRRLGRLPVVLNLWASWCGPCRQEMPAYQQVYRQVKGRVHFLGVNTNDSPRSARETVQLTAVSYPSLVDPRGTLRKELGGVSALGMPTTLLLDAEGRVRNQLVGEQSADDLRSALRDLGVEL